MAEVQQAANSLPVFLCFCNVELGRAVGLKEGVVGRCVSFLRAFPNSTEQCVCIAVAGENHDRFFTHDIAALKELELVPGLLHRGAGLHSHLLPDLTQQLLTLLSG